jgi:hypothetical protein
MIVCHFQPANTWHWNETRTEQMGDVHLKNYDWTTAPSDRDIFSALGLRIHAGLQTETNEGTMTVISDVTPGSIADHSGQLQIGTSLVRSINVDQCLSSQVIKFCNGMDNR